MVTIQNPRRTEDQILPFSRGSLYSPRSGFVQQTHAADALRARLILNVGQTGATIFGDEMINVKELGAKGDGQTDDTAAVLSALSSVPLMGGVIYFPVGRYLLSATISLAGKSVGFLGDGRGVTCLEWTSNRDGIRYRGSGSSPATLTTFSIEKLSLTTRVEATEGTALTLEWPNTPFNPLAKLRISDIEIRGANFDPTLASPPTTWWRTRILIKNPGGLDISHVNILGNAFRSTTALRCETVGSNAYRHFLSNIFVRWFDIGVDWAGPVEGVYMNNFELVACRIGFRAIASDAGGTVWHISNGHMDCREVCAQFVNHTIIKLGQIAFFHTGNNPPRLAGNLVQFDRCQWVTVSSCSFLGFWETAGFTSIAAQNGIVATNCDEVLLASNHIDLIGNYAMIFGAGTVRAHATGNRAVAVGGRWLNDGDADNTDDRLGE